jgi:hypothetical protein
MKNGRAVQIILRVFLNSLMTVMLVLEMGGFMKFAVEMDSGVSEVCTKFHEDWFRHSEVGKGDVRARTHAHACTEREQGDLISLLLFFKHKESRLKI